MPILLSKEKKEILLGYSFVKAFLTSKINDKNIVLRDYNEFKQG